jgi:stearoyl-CoA desaturase (Delta-9 desaturase)
MSSGAAPSFRDVYLNAKSLPFWGIHLAAIYGVAVLGWSWSGLALAVALYYARMFFVTAGYHRYFSHRTFKTSRFVQFLFALFACTAAQKGPLWWAAHHRRHHRFSDQEGDVHSPRRGFWWSHVGWITSRENDETDLAAVRDLARYPELHWLNRWNLVPPTILAVVLFLVGGWHALLWGFAVSTVLLWHGTFTINSLSHIIGRRRYETTDDSRNNWALALITMGEGWHNNHHHFMTSANQGFRWYEVDMSYYIIRLLEMCGVVRNVRRAPRHIVEGRPRRAPVAAGRAGIVAESPMATQTAVPAVAPAPPSLVLAAPAASQLAATAARFPGIVRRGSRPAAATRA